MSIKKRGEFWHIDIKSPDGTRIRRSAGTTDKRKAQEYHDKLKSDCWDFDKLNKKPQKLFEDAVVLFLNDSKEQKNFSMKQTRSEYFLSYFAGRELNSISSEEIIRTTPELNINTGKKLSNATKNRYRADIMRIFSLAYKMGWINSVPYVPRAKEPSVRVSWITREKASVLIQNLRLDWMKDTCKFALLTGARMSEIFTLTWANVDFVNKVATVTNENAKSGRARALLLNQDAINLLRNRRFKIDSEHVFTRETGKRVYDIDRRDFNDACKLSGLNKFHFHDLRHTWASWHVQAGTPLFTLKELGGWETLEMVKKYAHLNADHMLEFANNVTFMAQSKMRDTKTKAVNQ